jgi:hypothetical protein
MEQDTLRRLIRNKLAGGNLPRGALGAVSQTNGSSEVCDVSELTANQRAEAVPGRKGLVHLASSARRSQRGSCLRFRGYGYLRALPFSRDSFGGTLFLVPFANRMRAF